MCIWFCALAQPQHGLVFPAVATATAVLANYCCRFCAIASWLTRHFNKTTLLSCVSFFISFNFYASHASHSVRNWHLRQLWQQMDGCASRTRTHEVSLLFQSSNERGIEDNAIRNVTMTYVCLHTRRYSFWNSSTIALRANAEQIHLNLFPSTHEFATFYSPLLSGLHASIVRDNLTPEQTHKTWAIASYIYLCRRFHRVAPCARIENKIDYSTDKRQWLMRALRKKRLDKSMEVSSVSHQKNHNPFEIRFPTSAPSTHTCRSLLVGERERCDDGRKWQYKNTRTSDAIDLQ